LFEASGSFKEGFGRMGAPRWEFRCKLHGTKTLNTRGLEPRKLEDKEVKVVTDRQRNTMVKANKDCGFNYLLSHKAVSKGGEERSILGRSNALPILMSYT
jgi:hypothetical protein